MREGGHTLVVHQWLPTARELVRTRYRNKGVTGFPHPYLRAGEPTNGDYPMGEAGPPAHLYTDRIGVRSTHPKRHEPIDIRERMLRAKVRDGFTCRCCGARSRLCIHHRQGTKSHRLGTLITLCEDCHKAQHGLEASPCAPH
jgi:hypothetical protein